MAINNTGYGNNAPYGNDGKRANTTSNVDASMLGIAWAKAIQSSGKAHGRSASADADNDDDAVYGNKATHDNQQCRMQQGCPQAAPLLGRHQHD